MQTNVAEGLTSLKNQIQASGAERRKLVPRIHKKSPFGYPNSKKNFWGGEQSPPQTHPLGASGVSVLARRAYGVRTRRLRRLVLSVPFL